MSRIYVITVDDAVVELQKTDAYGRYRDGGDPELLEGGSVLGLVLGEGDVLRVTPPKAAN